MHNIGIDHTYDSINENSSDEEKFNIIFDLLKKSNTWDWLSHHKLKISQDKINVFEARLIKTGLVDYQQDGYYHIFKLSQKGIIELDAISFLDYIGYKKPKDIFLITPALKDKVLSFICANCQLEKLSQAKTDLIIKELEIDFDAFNGIISQFQRFGFLSDLNLRISDLSFVLRIEAHDFWQKGGFVANEEIFKANIQKLGYEIDKLKNELGSQHLETVSKISSIASAIFSGLSLFRYSI